MKHQWKVPINTYTILLLTRTTHFNDDLTTAEATIFSSEGLTSCDSSFFAINRTSLFVCMPDMKDRYL